MAKYPRMIEGEDGWCEWQHPEEDYKMACCDCGLIHNMQFQLSADNKLLFRASRNNRATAAMRRHKQPGDKA